MTTDKKRDDGGTAFPVDPLNSGMTLRDYFAAAALLGVMLSDMELARQGKETGDEHQTAETAYNIADAMLKQKRKP